MKAEKPMINTAVIFAGGVGTRMNSKDIPKQFLMIHGRPIIVRTLDLFQQCDAIDNIVVACVADKVEHCKSFIDRFGLDKVKLVVPGGKTGQCSIANGLRAASQLSDPNETVVLIHDGVRPLVDEGTILRNIDGVVRYGSAVTCVNAKETVLLASGHSVRRIVPRQEALLARAPQSFILSDILAAHEWAEAKGCCDYIDSACLMSDYGKELHLIDGPDENIKITTQEDYYAMRAILDAHENNQLYCIERDL